MKIEENTQEQFKRRPYVFKKLNDEDDLEYEQND